MRELEREPFADTPACTAVALVGAGRMGRALAEALPAGGVAASGPWGRGYDGRHDEVVLLCVPDGEIAAAAAMIRPGRLVGHCSGATGLDGLAPHESFSMHPLMTVTGAGASFSGAAAAVAGSTPRALAVARRMALALSLAPVQIGESDRALYHAAASLASNFLLAVEGAAEQLGAAAGLSREALVPLVRATVESWARLGAQRALTGPITRGDEDTVARQRQAVREREPALLDLFDALCEATRALARREPQPR